MFNLIIGLIHQLESTTGHLLDRYSTPHQTEDKFISTILHVPHIKCLHSFTLFHTDLLTIGVTSFENAKLLSTIIS